MPRPQAFGSIDPRAPEYRQLVVRFDHETFDQIRDRAVAENTSVGEQVRLLVTWGLESVEDEA